MQCDTFLAEVQHRLVLPTEGKAAEVTRGVLKTLGERLGEGEESELGSQLPREIDRYLTAPKGGHQFSCQEFVDRIAERCVLEEEDAFFAAQTVIALLDECATGTEVQQVRAQLPNEYDELFEFAEAEATPW